MSASSCEWRLHLLAGRIGHLAVAQLLSVVKRILHHDVLLDAMDDVLLMSRQNFKGCSHEGFHWIECRMHDLGHYSYVLLYQCLMRLAAHESMPVAMRFIHIGALYPSMEIKAPPTTKSFSMKGDLIENALAMEQGTFNALIVEYEKAIANVFMITFACDYGYPIVKHCPLPYHLAEAIFLANVTQYAGGRSCGRSGGRINTKFHRAVRAAKDSVGIRGPCWSR